MFTIALIAMLTLASCSFPFPPLFTHSFMSFRTPPYSLLVERALEEIERIKIRREELSRDGEALEEARKVLQEKVGERGMELVGCLVDGELQDITAEREMLDRMLMERGRLLGMLDAKMLPPPQENKEEERSEILDEKKEEEVEKDLVVE